MLDWLDTLCDRRSACAYHRAPDGAIPRPSQQRSQIPARFDDVIARGLAKDPQGRYASAGELARAAHRALSAPDQDNADSILADTQAAANGDHTELDVEDVSDGAGNLKDPRVGESVD